MVAGAKESAASTAAAAEEAVIPPAWEEAAAAIAFGDGGGGSAPVVVVCGPKNSGKSTFSRYLLNTLSERYSRVGYLDTDVGQPEFTTPGCLSLHLIDESTSDLMNPCIKAPERCIFFGDISSKRDPKGYLSCTFSLYDYFLNEYHQPELDGSGKEMLPLIINTPGWVKGTGFDVLVDMLRHIAPTHVVQTRITAENKNLPTGAFWLYGEHERPVDLIYICPAHIDSSNRSVLIQKDARGMRDRRLFDYFKQCFPSSLNIMTNKELARALASLPPYEVPFSTIEIMHLHCEVPKSEVFHSLNATIVGLASRCAGSATQCHIPWCFGLGIVRAVDTRRGLLYVITPVPPSSLGKVDLLLQGFIEIPTGLLQALLTMIITREDL